MKKNHFSKKHWIVMIMGMVLYTIVNASSIDGENVFLPRIAQANGWDYSRVLSIASIAGILSIFLLLAIGQLSRKKGARFTIVFCAVLTAVFLIPYTSSHNIVLYTIGFFGTISCDMACAYFGITALVANWFPTKKGIAMGIVAMGPPISSMVMVSVLKILTGKLGLTGGSMVISVILLIMAALSFILLRDRPEDFGETPDSMPPEEYEKLKQMEEAQEKIDLRDFFRHRDTWRIIYILGVCSLTLTGLLSQFVVRFTNSGFAENQAILYLSITAAIGIFGSNLVGRLITKFGSKKAYYISGMFLICGLLLNFTNVRVLIWISLVLFGFSLTLIQLFLNAFIVAVFGRKNYEVANSMVFPIVNVAGQVSLLIISICLTVFGEIRYSYLVFAVLMLISFIFCRRLKNKKEI